MNEMNMFRKNPFRTTYFLFCFFFESSEYCRVFNYLHDSNSIFRTAGIISEGVSRRHGVSSHLYGGRALELLFCSPFCCFVIIATVAHLVRGMHPDLRHGPSQDTFSMFLVDLDVSNKTLLSQPCLWSQAAPARVSSALDSFFFSSGVHSDLHILVLKLSALQTASEILVLAS